MFNELEKDMSKVVMAIGLMFVMLASGVIGAWDREEEERQLVEYCDKVSQHRRNPAAGWPDYLGTYATVCGKAARSK